jgi:hypothetical protein
MDFHNWICIIIGFFTVKIIWPTYTIAMDILIKDYLSNFYSCDDSNWLQKFWTIDFLTLVRNFFKNEDRIKFD